MTDLPEPWQLYPMPAEQTAAIQRHIEARIGQAATRTRGQVADEIKAALAEDEADDDVSSGEAIWEQGGYRRGLAAAAEIARGEQ